MKLSVFVRGVQVGVIAMLASAGMASAEARGLSVQLDAAKTAIAPTEDVTVRFSLQNTTGHDLFVLYHQTALRGIYNDLFEVRRDGKPVEYIGREYKWAAPQASDFLRVRAGETLSANVELTSAYDMSLAGEYTVRFRTGLSGAVRGKQDALRALENQSTLTSNAVGFDVDRAAPGIDLQSLGSEAIESAGLGALAPAYVSCSSSRQTTLVSALNAAQTMATKARTYLNAGTVDSGYTTWFGTYNSSRYNTANSHFNSIYSAFTTKTMTFYCDCTDSAYAYVYKNQPYRIHLCNAFWSAPLTGTDSKGGTLVHEVSHFNAVASTDDWAYGQTACRNLAISNPSRAIDNADSHEYFAESRP